EGDRHVRLQKTVDAAVVLNRHDEDGDFDLMVCEVRLAAKRCAIVVKDSSTGATAALAVAAGPDDGCGLLISKELGDLVGHAVALHVSAQTRLHVRSGAVVYWVLGKLFQFLVRVAFEENFVERWNIAHFSEQYNLAGELSFVLVEVFIVLDIDVNSLTAD